MGIVEKLNAIKDTVPHYWPIGAFIHHNPLKGFEGMKFKEGLDNAQDIFGGQVYMAPDYYVERYSDGRIKPEHLEKNLKLLLEKENLDTCLQDAIDFMIKVSPTWKSLRSYAALKVENIDASLHSYLEEHALCNNKEAWIASLTKNMTLYEIHDALFDTSEKELIEKDVIEFVARFLDQQQTTFSMADRDLGMFKAFQLYEDIDYVTDVESFVEEALETLKVENVQEYFLTHILKLHGWAGYIKYRSEDQEYFPQQEHPSTLMDYMAIRLHYEMKYMRGEAINNFDKLRNYIEENQPYAILKLLQARGKLTGTYNDAMEEGTNYQEILDAYITDEINLNSVRVQLAKKELPDSQMSLIEFSNFANLLKKEEGYIWLKSLEDSYITDHVEAFLQAPSDEDKPISSTIFCLDVRSEVMRRKVEASGPYTTYGAGGFLGIPIQFVEFDKAHHLNLAPAVIKPKNIIFEIPVETHEEYNSKKGIQKTTKKVLSDLKNNPYTPYIMVESIGWLFGVKLFGKTFFPKKTNALFQKFKPKKPKTTYTLDKLSEQEIEKYMKKLHVNIIKEVMTTQYDTKLNDADIENVWQYLVFGSKLRVKISENILDKLEYGYHISKEDYETQKEKLKRVGFTEDEQVLYIENLLKMIGLVDNFPKFVVISGHGSCSDNNPFESALDCGACGGSSSLPNARTHCMIGNKPEIRAKLRERGVNIPDDTVFIPSLHNTTTDEMSFYDTDVLSEADKILFDKMDEDFKAASLASREERVKVLPNAKTEEDLFIKTMDWTEPRPEWGLARNMGVFAGPRDTLKHMEFGNRLFLHSYDADIDDDNAEILTRIFNGPLVVGEWINLEHYFATVDNAVYGAGSKVYHNVVSKVGVYNGNYSDLKIGLPTQSVSVEGDAYHEPVRLLTYMEAPLETVGKAVENANPDVREFILNEWIRPVVIDKAAKKVYSFENGDFVVIKELG